MTRILFRPLEGLFHGAWMAGIYGAFHDLVTYRLEPTYFEEHKFPQFMFCDYGQPIWQFVMLIGFLASWWAGAAAGWILVRCSGLCEVKSGWRSIFFQGVGLVILTAFTLAVVAYLSGGVAGETLVSTIHAASYAGALIGLIPSLLWIRRQLRRRRDRDGSCAF